MTLFLKSVNSMLSMHFTGTSATFKFIFFAFKTNSMSKTKPLILDLLNNSCAHCPNPFSPDWVSTYSKAKMYLLNFLIKKVIILLLNGNNFKYSPPRFVITNSLPALNFWSTSFGKSLAGRVAVRLGAGLVSGVNALPEGDMFSKSVFSGKATIKYQIKSATKVISVMGNTMKPIAVGQSVPVETIDLGVAPSSIKVLEIKRVEGTVPLPEAEIVVSAGRGLKDPSNWGIIEDLAKALGATTACSRPVADAGWRPHHEHVGQTGIAIRPNLYFAIGISGAIQHLAGVNNSKTIVVINKDPEAPFFKAGDYGVCGDLFEIVPKLTEAVKKFKETHS